MRKLGVLSVQKATKKVAERELSKQKGKTWDACSKFVRARDQFCVCCGSPFNLQAGHVIKRGRGNTLFDLTNVNAQCNSCNIRHNHYPEFYINWYIAKYGQARYDQLVFDSWQTKDWTVDELKQLEAEFKAMKEAL